MSSKDVERVAQEREHAEEYVLSFIKKIFNKQVKAGRYAHLIHPSNAVSWHTPHFRSLFCAYTFQIDECVYIEMDHDAQEDAKSPWTLKTNKPDMKYSVKECPVDHN